jgi:hypothetical protein
MNDKRGRKLIHVLRMVAKGMKTKNEIEDETGIKPSEARELILKGLREGYIEKWKRIGARGVRGRPISGKKEESQGRPADVYSLTDDGKWLIRFDPFIRAEWGQVEKAYEILMPNDVWDSYTSFLYAIRNDPLLRKFQKPDEFMENELQQVIFKPFVFAAEYKIENVEQLYDKLIDCFTQSVRPEHIVGYYSSLESCFPQLQGIVDRCELLMRKMQTIPKVQEYLERHS